MSVYRDSELGECRMERLGREALAGLSGKRKNDPLRDVKKTPAEADLRNAVDVRVIRSKRKTISIQVKPEGVIVRAPRYTGRAEIDRCVKEHSEWIRKQLQKVGERERAKASVEKLTNAELGALKRKASKVFPERVEHFARIAGVTYGRITIRAQRTRWGSCSAKGNLNFNCLLLLAPPEVLDSVVVHELCHRKEMNHSARFYEEVNRLFPGYSACDRWLKENGPLLLARIGTGSGPDD